MMGITKKCYLSTPEIAILFFGAEEFDVFLTLHLVASLYETYHPLLNLEEA